MKRIGYSILVLVFGCLCFMFGLMSKTFYTIDMVNIHLQQEDNYILELSLTKELLKTNKGIDEIEKIVNFWMADLLVDLSAPPPVKDSFKFINIMRCKEKIKVYKDFLESLKNREKFKVPKIHQEEKVLKILKGENYELYSEDISLFVFQYFISFHSFI